MSGVYYTEYSSPVGPLVIAAERGSIVGLWLEGQKYFQASLKNPPERKDDLEILCRAGDWLNRYFAGEKPTPQELPLAPSGSEFRRRVWKHLCDIPYGETTTYGEIAVRVASEMGKGSMSAQAVGGAVGHNPISIIIPCHRVVGADGSLTGYAGGIGKKIKLLQLEGVRMERLYIPKKGSAL